MNTLRDIALELCGLFVDDGRFALVILGMVALAAISTLAGAPPLVSGGVLFGGCLLGLVLSVLQAASKR